MTTDLIKPDLSKDTTGPFVTRDGRKARFLRFLTGMSFPYRFIIEDHGEEGYREDGRYFLTQEYDLDIFLDQGVPVDGSVVKRVET